VHRILHHFSQKHMFPPANPGWNRLLSGEMPVLVSMARWGFGESKLWATTQNTGCGVHLMSQRAISINRAPVLTLWAAVVAERLGFNEDEALSLGKALAGLNAQAKGRRLGIFKPHEQKPHKAREKAHGEQFAVDLLGRPVPASSTQAGVRAMKGEQAIHPASRRRPLPGKQVCWRAGCRGGGHAAAGGELRPEGIG
jgi:hypothetical protein